MTSRLRHAEKPGKVESNCGLTMEAILIEEDVVFVMILLQQLGCLGRRLLGQTGKVIHARVVQ